MKKLIFIPETYVVDPQTEALVYKPSDKRSIIGLLELLYTSIETSPLSEMTKKDHKVNSALKAKLIDVTRFKDKNEDSRVASEGTQVLILEEPEYELMKKLVEANKFISRVSYDLTRLWDVIDDAKEYKIAQIVNEG